MSLNYDGTLIPLAKRLRKEMTRQEKHLWYDFLSKYPVRFQRQKTIDSYIAAFYCHKVKLVVGIDSVQYYTDETQQYNNEKTSVLDSYGLNVMRFSDNDIDKNFDNVCSSIDLYIKKQKKFLSNKTYMR